MKYDFDKQIQRRGTDSYKWDSAESGNVLPMWVADMEFHTAPAIVNAFAATCGAWYLWLHPCA